jgi:hypothetical protein
MFGRLRQSIAATLLTSIFAAPTFAQHIVIAREVLLEEFATVRLIIPGLRHKVGPDETRSGIMLTFLRFQ